RNELVQHGIGALEGGEYVCIGAEGGQPVLCHVALAAAYLPCVLNRGYGVVGCVCLEACGERLDLARRVFVLDREATRQLLERELDRVCRCKRREEAPLHGEVVQDRHLGLTLRPELTPLRGVANADGERRLCGTGGGACGGDAAGDECTEHREEAAARTRDRARVGAGCIDAAEAVEQILARYPHVVEVEAPVVDAVQPLLLAAVLDAHACAGSSVRVTDRHEQRVHAVSPARRLELGE